MRGTQLRVTRLAHRVTYRRVVEFVSVGLAIMVVSPTAARAQSKGKVSLDTVTFAQSLDIDVGQAKHLSRSVYVRDLIVGTGRLATRGDELTVRYVGSISDGRTFTEPNEPPATFKLGAGTVIPGWERGLGGMRVGGRRQLIIAPDQGYGSKQTGAIPPNSVLVFEVELLAVR